MARKNVTDVSKLKIAIVCDWLTGTGGAERVVLEMHRLFPSAPIYTSQYNKSKKIWYGGDWFGLADVRTGWLQRLPVRLKKFLPVLRARYFNRLDLTDYDLVIISSSAEAKYVRTRPDATVVWYCHAPTHYYWSRYEEYMKHPGFGWLNPLARLGLWLLARPLRRIDHAAAQKPMHILANSTHIQADIKKYYGQESTVLFPPVDTDRFKPVKDKRERYGFVVAGRQTPYKRIDLAVEACSRLKLPLTVIGSGPDHDRLTAMAGQSVRFLSKVSDSEMAGHFQRAAGFIFPGVDDFGIVAVEALSAGTPLIAYQAGGALDYVKPGVSGVFFAEQTVDSLSAALRSFEPGKFNASKVRRSAGRYSVEAFRGGLQAYIEKAVRK